MKRTFDRWLVVAAATLLGSCSGSDSAGGVGPDESEVVSPQAETGKPTVSSQYGDETQVADNCKKMLAGLSAQYELARSHADRMYPKHIELGQALAELDELAATHPDQEKMRKVVERAEHVRKQLVTDSLRIGETLL